MPLQPFRPPQEQPTFQPVDLVVPVNLKNTQAALAGYLGILSFFCLGPVLGIPAIIYGILGFKKRAQLGGSGRALTGIICGSLGTLLWLYLVLSGTFR